MADMETLLNVVVVCLLLVALVHAVRLQRMLRVFRRDRAALEGTVLGFSDSTRAAEAGIERLRGVADGTARQIARQIDVGSSLRDDLNLLIERGDQMADRLDALVRSARPKLAGPRHAEQSSSAASPVTGVPEHGVRDDVMPMAGAGGVVSAAPIPDVEPAGGCGGSDDVDERREEVLVAQRTLAAVRAQRPRSQAELNLLRALRLVP